MTLRGKQVLVTRAAEDCAELEALLRERGGAPVRMPCIAFQDGPELGQIVQNVREAELVIVSSPHAARRLRELCGDDLYKTRLAAVGAATARALRDGHEVIAPDEGAGAEAILAKLKSSVRGVRVLLPRAERSTPALAQGLEAAGAIVTQRILYKTIVPQSAPEAALAELRAGRIAALSFGSGSAVRGFVQLCGAALAERSAVACLGRSAREAALAAGLRVGWTGQGESLAELCDGLELAVEQDKD